MQAKELKKLEKDLWDAADQLRANSKLTASEYSMPVLGLIFLRHAYNRYTKVKFEIENNLTAHPERGKRPLNKNDFIAKNAMYLPPKAQFDYLVNLPESTNIGEAINDAMQAIEDEHETLVGVLPNNYGIFSNDLLQELLRIFNKEVLRTATEDLFGKIYEYFLNEFAKTGAQEGGEFFTPFSLVNTIVNVIEPDHGVVFDPAVGSAGMFVQTGYFIESEGLKPAEKVTFFGQEKTETNTKLAKMNLAVHGLEGSILDGNTFYEDKHDLVGACDFVMANPPFNVDKVDKDRDFVKKDPRLPFGLPKNDNANYLWIQYFYSYLKPTGRAGFVMASSASDAGHSEKDIREKLIKTGAVDVMLAIGNNFFYTRSLPCTLWFFDRAKEQIPERKDEILMLDARKIFHKVTSKINDFSPEQLKNLMCIVALYRGNGIKLYELSEQYLKQSMYHAIETADNMQQLLAYLGGITKVTAIALTLIGAIKRDEDFAKVNRILATEKEIETTLKELISICRSADGTKESAEKIANTCRSKSKELAKMLKQYQEGFAILLRELKLQRKKDWEALNTKNLLNPVKELEQKLMGKPDEEEPGLMNLVDYFYKQAHWLLSRFPDGNYRDVEGLCKVVTQQEVAAKDYSLSPGRYVGVATYTDDDFDYVERLKEIHLELTELNKEAELLINQIMDEEAGLLT